jgi:hypothetical protein
MRNEEQIVKAEEKETFAIFCSAQIQYSGLCEEFPGLP